MREQIPSNLCLPRGFIRFYWTHELGCWVPLEDIVWLRIEIGSVVFKTRILSTYCYFTKLKFLGDFFLSVKSDPTKDHRSSIHSMHEFRIIFIAGIVSFQICLRLFPSLPSGSFRSLAEFFLPLVSEQFKLH